MIDDRPRAAWSDTPSRLLTIAVGLPTMVAGVYAGGWFYTALILTIGLFCALELRRVIYHDNRALLPGLIVGGTILAAGAGLLTWAGLLALLPLITAIAAYFARRFNLMVLLIGALYAGLTLALLVSIRAEAEGMGWTYMLFVNTWATDTFALVGGRLFGRRKLAPAVSGAKTWEGAVTGWASGTLAGLFVALLFGLPPVLALALNPLLALLIIVGDLIESVFKRSYRIKDTSNFLPGHGGFLDRFDGVALAVIPLYAALIIT